MMRFLIFLSNYLVGAMPDAGVQVWSSSVPSSLSNVFWFGTSSRTCDNKCKESCLLSAKAIIQWGESNMDTCVASCGCGSGSDRVLALPESGKAKTSSDGGTTWTDFDSLLPPKLMRGITYRIAQAHVSHTDPQLIVLVTNSTSSLISRNGGTGWTALKLNTTSHGEQRIHAWYWHPMKPDWALATSLARPTGKSSGARLFVTQDAGATWQLLSERVEQCRWAIRPGGDARRVILSRYAAENAGSGSSHLEVITSEDFMASKKVLIGADVQGARPRSAHHVSLHNGWTFASVSDVDSSAKDANMQLWFYSEASNQNMPSSGFRLVQWPSNVHRVLVRQLKHLQVLYASEHLAHFYIPTENPMLPWGHVFSVNYWSSQADLVLTDVHHPGALQGFSWRAVHGLDGVFIANRVVLDQGQNLDKVERSFDAQAKALENMDGIEDSDTDDETWNDVDIKARLKFTIRTYISVDMGLAWQPLMGPEKGPSGEIPTGCDRGNDRSKCRLHLASWTSSTAAPGILLGVGNLGVRLSDNSEHFNLYSSRDAGLTWQMCRHGPHKVGIISHADVLVAVPEQSPHEASFSTDGGRQWQTTPLKVPADSDISIDGVFAHPAHADLKIILALSSDTSSSIWLKMLDFTAVLKASCKQVNDAGGPSSDFEKWSPADSLEDAHVSKRPVCLFGVRSNYVRRKADRQCKTGSLQLTSSALRKDAPCRCVMEDFACDVGFYRASYEAQAPCEPMDGIVPPNVTGVCAETTDTHVYVTRGYVKIAGNRCEGGLEFAPVKELCVGNTGLVAYVRNIVRPRYRAYIALASIAALLFFWIQRRRFEVSLARCLMLKKIDKENNSGFDDDEREFLIGERQLP